MAQNDKYFNISLASVVSAIAVVILHTNGVFWQFSATERYWFTVNIIECVFYFSVPVFLMITGATLLSFYDRYGIKEYCKRRFNKTVIPYLFWSLVGILFCVYYEKSILPEELSVVYIANKLLEGRCMSVYWFFIPLFNVYLCIPLFAAIDNAKRIHVLKYVTLISILFNSLFPFLINVFNLKLSMNINVAIGSQYLVYVLLGYILQNTNLQSKGYRTIYFLGIMGLLLHIFGTYYSSIEAGRIVNTYKEYENVPCLMYSCAVFTLIKQGSTHLSNINWLKALIYKLANYTFPMYLLHQYIMIILRNVFLINRYSIVWRIGGVIPIACIVIIVTQVIRRVPIIKKILP